MKSNLQLMRDAKASLKGKWGSAALATLVVVLVDVVAAAFGGVGTLIVGGPMLLGYVFFLMAIRAGGDPKMEILFSGFKDFLRAFLTYLLMVVFILLWGLLFVIPGIIMFYAYSMTFFIIAEDKEISAMDAIRRSRDMMRGYKWKLFCLQLRFIGWLILSCLTFGILSLWVQPYMVMAALNFYHEVKAEWEARGGAKA